MGRAWGKREMHRGLVGKLMERDQLEDLGVGGRAVLKWTLRKYYGRAWTGFFWLWIGKVADSCVHSNELSSFPKCR
jgi:hypothetical protein